MHPRAAERCCVRQRLGKTFAKLGFASGQAGQAALTGVPIARGCVEKHLLQAMVLQMLMQLVGGKRLRKQIFHRAKAILGGGGEAVQKSMLWVEQG